MGRPILALNCGSSSLKFGLYEAKEDGAQAILHGEAEEIGGEQATFWFEEAGKERSKNNDSALLKTHASALQQALKCMQPFPAPAAVGHRFVHGGPKLREHTLIDAGILRELDAAIEFAPLHMPAALAVLRAASESLPEVPQAACFDTAFHRSMPEVSRTYALPQAIRALGVERYGFHGLSLESIVGQLKPLPERLVAAHLGNGASITAIHKGKSLDTSMGLTPTGGIVMGTRCGDLDPGVVIYLLRHGYAVADELEEVFDQQSGLKGLSGFTSDVRELLQQRAERPEAELALRVFCYQAAKAIGAMAAALGGIDLLVFTGGIGEHATKLRASIVEQLRFLGDPLAVKVLPSQEDEQIARNTARLIAL